jgi:hypothetical protein
MFNMNYNNLLRLMSIDDIAASLRRSVIMKHPIKFDRSIDMDTALKTKEFVKGMEKSCKIAMAKVLTSSNYSLIEGDKNVYPFLAAFLRIMIMTKKKVILASSNSTRLLETLVYLKDEGVSFMKIGGTSRVPEALHHLCEDTLLEKEKTVVGIKKLYSKQSIVSGNIYQIVNHPFYEQNVFDICVLIEENKSLMTMSLGPLFRSLRFLVIRHNSEEVFTSNGSRDETISEDSSLFGRLKFESNILVI